MERKHIKTFVTWLAFFNWPPVLIWVPPLRLVCFLPLLLWINVPALGLGLAKAVGQPHYDVQEFGAMPQTPLAWILIAGFWSLLSLGLTVATAHFPGLVYRKHKEETPNHENHRAQ